MGSRQLEDTSVKANEAKTEQDENKSKLSKLSDLIKLPQDSNEPNVEIVEDSQYEGEKAKDRVQEIIFRGKRKS
ncbi:tRNA uridine-5-carboxymethylaminomethy [Sesbania bispinosa]|nr:tRNA uridine-5-carboxymethylaminomethy [Sesbania bispinosa]